VQQRLAETADRVWELLEAGAHFYICGDASSMAGAVEAELLRIIAARLGGAGSGAGARAYLDRMAAEHRYEKDVWY
jgi:sulfite reductase (NADPH) flavoprotein alpha-component